MFSSKNNKLPNNIITHDNDSVFDSDILHINSASDQRGFPALRNNNSALDIEPSVAINVSDDDNNNQTQYQFK